MRAAGSRHIIALAAGENLYVSLGVEAAHDDRASEERVEGVEGVPVISGVEKALAMMALAPLAKRALPLEDGSGAAGQLVPEAANPATSSKAPARQHFEHATASQREPAFHPRGRQFHDHCVGFGDSEQEQDFNRLTMAVAIYARKSLKGGAKTCSIAPRRRKAAHSSHHRSRSLTP